MELESAIREAVTRLEALSLDAFEVVGLKERSLTIDSKKQMVDRAQASSKQGVSIRAIKDGRMGFSTALDMNPKSVIQAVKGALDSVKSVAPSDEAVLPAPQPAHGTIDETPRRTLADVPFEEKAALARAVESAAFASDSRVSKVQQSRYGEDTRALLVINSQGVESSFVRGLCFCQAKVVASEGAGSESAYELGFASSFDDLRPEEVARLAASRSVAKLGAESAPGGQASVLFEPRPAAAMLSLLAPSFFADNVQRGKSRLASRLGERIFSSCVTVVDDGLLRDGCNTFAFDWEGIPKRRTVLVRDGSVESWLYDGARASRDGVVSTGSSVRETLGRQPSVGVSNCFLKAGSISPDALIGQLRSGVVITDLLGLHTANPISGAFSLGLEGFLVEGGVRRAPVRGMTLAGNVHDLFDRVVAVGSDLRFTGTFGAPSMLAEGLTLGS